MESSKSLLKYWKRDPKLVLILLNIKKLLDQNYDFVLAITGETGTGKSIFSLHILELWLRVILGKDVSEEDIKMISSDKYSWLSRFKEMEKFDVNILDEGVTALNSKLSMNKLSKDLEKLYEVFRKKNFFSIIIIPNFFRLNKYFREDRLRGLFYIDKKGSWKYYTKNDIKWLNVLNENRKMKTFHGVMNAFDGNFQDYKGILREYYDSKSIKEVDKILDEVIEENYISMKSEDIYFDKVLELKESGMSQQNIKQTLNVSSQTVSRIIKKAKLKKLID